MEQEISEELMRLHFLTMKFTKAKDSSVAEELNKTITQIDEHTLIFFKPYILMEICESIKEAKNIDRKLELVKTASVLIDKTPGGAIQQHGLFIILSDIISLDQTQIPEELFIAALKCMINICTKCPLEIKCRMFIKMNTPLLGKSIYAATQLARKHICSEIKFLSMKYVLSICNLENIDFIKNKEKHEIRFKIAEVLMFFLPGIVSVCQEVAISNVKKQHRVTVMALRVWGRIIALVMEDSDVKDSQAPTTSDFLNLVNSARLQSEEKLVKDWSKSGISNILEYLNETKRTKKWMQETSSKILSLFPHLAPLITHEHPDIRLELMSNCELILNTAWHNCGDCKPELLAILFSLSRDDVSSIAKTSEESIKFIVAGQSSAVVVRLIENALYKRVNVLPNLINYLNEHELMFSLDFIIGIFKNLGERAKEIFIPQIHERLIDVLLVIVQIDVSAVPLDENSPGLDNLNHLPCKLLPPFRHICDSYKEILQKVELLCYYLASTNGIYLMDILFARIEHGESTLESIILSTFILKASGIELLDICNSMLKYWQYDNIWYLPTVTKPNRPGGPNYKSWYYSDHTPGLYEGSLEVRYTDVSTVKEDEEDQHDPNFCKNLHELKYNTMLIALQCEAVGCLAITMKLNFRRYFLKYLYLIIERCGHRRQLIQGFALSAAKNLQKFVNVNSLSELINANADYLINSIYIKLNHIINYNASDTGVWDALVIVLENCTDLKHLNSFADVIKKVEELNCMRGDLIISILRVYKSFLKQLIVLYGSHPKNYNNVLPNSKNSLLGSIKELQAATEIAKEAEFNEIMTGENNDSCIEECAIPNNDRDDSHKISAPEHVSLASKILKRCIPFISSVNNNHQLTALDVVQTGLPLLSEHEDTLLPALHEIWSPVALRLRRKSEADLKVLRQAFAVAYDLGSLGKDFLRQRAISSVLVEALKFLASNCEATKSKLDIKKSYNHTQLFKLQFEIISSLAEFCFNLQFGEKTRFEVMTVLYKYLHEDVKPELRKAARHAFIKMAEDNPADVSYFLARIWPLEGLPCEVECLKLKSYSKSVLEITKMIAAKW